MHFDRERLRELAAKRLRGTISEEESRELDRWLEQDLPGEMIWPIENETEAIVGERLLQRIRRSSGLGAPVKKMHPLLRYRNIAAAVFILIGLTLTVVLWRPLRSTSPAPIALALAPGQDKAILELPDGSKVALDKSTSGWVKEQRVARVEQRQDLLSVQRTGESDVVATQYHTLSTPRGAQFQLVLEDGSRVWLDAASSIRFPAAFGREERRVELRGQAYFEVAKESKRPFRVYVNGSETDILVLGTHFNVMAYAEESSVQTTLYEGSVRVSHAGDQLLLRPGQQSVLGADRLSLNPAPDLEQTISWKEGYFHLNNTPIQAIMRMVARWYDVQVQYEGSMEGLVFTGRLSRREYANQLFELLEATGTIKFRMKDGRVVVSKI